MKKVIEYLKQYRFRMTIGLIIKIIGTVMDLAIPLILSYIIDKIVPTKDVNKIIIVGSLMIVCSIVGLVGSVSANQMASKVAQLVTTDLRHDLFEKIETLSARQVDEVTVPSLVSRMSSDTYNVHQMIGMSQRIGVRAPILLIGGIIVTLTLDPILTLVLLSVLPLVVFVIYYISKKGLPLFTKVQLAIDDFVRVVRENITGIRVIKALSKEEYERNRFDKINKKLVDYELSSQKIMIKLNPIINVFLNIGMVAVIVVGAYRVNGGKVLSGKVLAFTTYFTIILNAMLSITRIFIVFSKAAASAERISYIMNLKSDLPIENTNDNIISNDYIVFDNVSFSYNKNKEKNIYHLSFSLKKGGRLGIIGPTGAGKSTIINLLMRFYDVDEGKIYIDGKNIKEYDFETLHKKFGVVFQNDMIFSTDIQDNINLSRGLTEEEITEASKVSQSYDFIMGCENGFNTELSERGANLSGGQRQRLLITRALANRPEILILDDATSALDYKTESYLRKGLKEKYSDTTSIIVAQRVSSIRDCDKIIMIDEGNILGIGNHKELMEKVKEYREIYQLQTGGGLDE